MDLVADLTRLGADTSSLRILEARFADGVVHEPSSYCQRYFAGYTLDETDALNVLSGRGGPLCPRCLEVGFLLTDEKSGCSFRTVAVTELARAVEGFDARPGLRSAQAAWKALAGLPTSSALREVVTRTRAQVLAAVRSDLRDDLESWARAEVASDLVQGGEALLAAGFPEAAAALGAARAAVVRRLEDEAARRLVVLEPGTAAWLAHQEGGLVLAAALEGRSRAVPLSRAGASVVLKQLAAAAPRLGGAGHSVVLELDEEHLEEHLEALEVLLADGLEVEEAWEAARAL
jgi:hypothetical protein